MRIHIKTVVKGENGQKLAIRATRGDQTVDSVDISLVAAKGAARRERERELAFCVEAICSSPWGTIFVVV